MRNGAALALALAVCGAGCGKRADPVPGTADAPGAASNAAAEQTPGSDERAAPTATASTAAETAPVPAAKASAAPLAVPVRFRALGTEPFWNAQIDGEVLTYTTPEDQKGQRATLARRDLPRGAEFSGKLGGAAIHVAVTKRGCSDGMSDRRYPLTVVLTLGSDRREGCAS